MVDTLAHALWSWIIFRNYAASAHTLWLAIFFGVAPDLFSWTMYFFYNLFTHGLKFGKPTLGAIPHWVFTLYGITHSIVVFVAVIGLCLVFFKSIPVYLWAWLIHILIDIPTHSRNFLPTPFLWPLSEWHFPGVSWGNPLLMALNWGGILFFVIKISLGKIRH